MKRNRDRKKTERRNVMVKSLNSVASKHAKEEAMAKEPKKIQIIDDTSVRELYANKLVSASFDGGAVVITLGVTRFVPEIVHRLPRRVFACLCM